jgi:hypothetical protein
MQFVFADVLALDETALGIAFNHFRIRTVPEDFLSDYTP